MGKIYKGQTKLTIKVNLGVDISGATSTLLKYEKPDGNSGNFIATILSATTGDIQYIPASINDLDVVGEWVMWGYVVFSDGKIASGEPFKLIINKEGT